MTRITQAGKNTMVAAASLLVLFVLLELLLRAYLAVNPRTMTLDERLGWKTPGGLDKQYRLTDYAGDVAEIHLQTNPNGFRYFGDARSERFKIFCIGDSYTLAKHVSQDEAYPALLREAMDAEFFVYGAEGYGTLQEFMILDEWIDTIEPDLILWQFSGNDFVNNALALERISVMNNNGLRRPYWTLDGRTVYATPRGGALWRNFAARYSRLLYFLITRVDALRVRQHSEETVEDRIAREPEHVPEYAEAVTITARLFEHVRKRAGSTPIVAFTTTEYDPFLRDFRSICEANGIYAALGVGGAVWAAHERGDSVLAADGGHWNANGHRIAADRLLANLGDLSSELSIPLKIKNSSGAAPEE